MLSRVYNRSRIGGVADDVVVVRSPPSGPEMSQTSQAHAHRRGMDVCRNTPPGGLVGARSDDVVRSRSPPSGAGMAAQNENLVGLFAGLYILLATFAKDVPGIQQTEW